MKPILIGVGHKARHGKDTFARFVKELYGSKFNIEILSFGAELKKEVNEVDQLEVCLREGIPYDFNPDMSDPLCQTKHGKQPRLLQWWGTEYRRASNPFYWVNKLKESISNLSDVQYVIIPDLRFRTEYLWIKSERGHTVKVSRKDYIDRTRSAKHISETELNNVKFDFEVEVEEGDLAGLRNDAMEVFDLIYKVDNPVVEEPGLYGIN